LKKTLKYFLIGLIALVLVLGALVSLVLWALHSAEGTRVLLKTISVFSPLRIEAGEVSGRLRDDLTIRGLRVQWLGGEFFTDRFHLRWEAAELLNRRVLVHEVSLDGARLKDDRPETGEFSFPGWPQTPLWLSRLEGRVDSLQVQNMLYQRGRGEPVRVDKLSTVLMWDGKVLRVKNFGLDSSLGHAEGSMEMGFSHPRLALSLQAQLAEKFAGVDVLLIQLRLEPVEKREEARGAFKVSGQMEGQEKLHCEGDLALTRAALAFQNLRFCQAQRRGLIRAEGEIPFSKKPRLRLKANISEFDLAPELGVATDLSAIVEVEGSLDGYKGQATFVNRSRGWEKAQGAVAFRGSLESLEITNVEAAWLDGSVKGPLKISWLEGISVQGKLQARNLNPSTLSPDWKGELNLDLEGKFLSPPGKPHEASFRVGLLKSRLFERIFSGDLEGSWQENLLSINQLRLRGPGFDLQGKGALQERLWLEATVADLAGFIPEVKGQMKASGWVRFKEDHLTGVMQAEGKEFLVKGIRAGDFRAELNLKDYSRKTAPLISVEARAGNIQAGSLKFLDLNFQVAGTPASHRARFAMALERAGIQGELTGAFTEGSWKGTLQEFSGRDDHGPWNLQAPVRITLSASQLRLSALDLKSGQEEMLTVRADLNLNPVSGTFQAQWKNLDLARANPWTGRGTLSGKTSGSVSAAGKKEGWQISGKVRFKGTFAQDRLRVEVSSGTVDLNWDGKGLLAEAALKLNQSGSLTGRLSSAEAFQFILPGEGKVEAHWKAIDLGLLQSFLPDPFVLKGKISGNFNGGWFARSRLDAAGRTEISQGQLIWNGGSKPISISLNKAEADFAWQGEEIQGNMVLASADYGNLEGRFLLPLAACFSPSFNPEGPLALSLRGQFRGGKILPALYPGWIHTSRGRAELDLRADGTFGHPRFKGTLGIFDAGIQVAGPKGATQNGLVPALLNLEILSALGTVDWGPKGLLSIFKATLNESGRIEAKVTSSEPARLAFPRQGEIDLLWSEINLSALQPLLPEGFLLEGRVDGKLRGAWLPEFRKSPQPPFAKLSMSHIFCWTPGGA
jgi:translocation and assembly module TamB